MNVAEKIIDEYKRQKSPLNKLMRWTLFKFGYSICRHCIHLLADGDKHRDFRESFLLNSGKCQ